MCARCAPGCKDLTIGMGPISGMSGVVEELMRHHGVERAEHLDVAMELEQAIAEEMVDTGREVLAAHGLLPADEGVTGGV